MQDEYVLEIFINFGLLLTILYYKMGDCIVLKKGDFTLMSFA